jgi:hypothetical protein
LFLTTLANQLNALAADSGAHISESDESIAVSNLGYAEANEILELCTGLGWPCAVYDEADTLTEPGQIVEEFSPFRLSIRKQLNAGGSLSLVTSKGFAYWLERGHPAHCWRVLGFGREIITQSRIFTDWSVSTVTDQFPETKSPRALVKEPGAMQTVPTDIRPWLITGPTQPDFANDLHRMWCVKAFDALVRTLANEIDALNGSLLFKGPPKLALTLRDVSNCSPTPLTATVFTDVQAAALWVYENLREAELKHSLLASEVARSGRADEEASLYLETNLSTALESAKITYQMSLSELGKDTLKSLSDLRKAITEETAKVTEATRQTITAVSGALAVCLGLLAARVTTDLNSWVIGVVMVVAIVYIRAIIYSGECFIQVQRGLRRDWQPKLYRFLPAEDYRLMVTDPAEQTEKVFKISARIGTGAVLVMCLVVLLFSIFGQPRASTPVSTAVKEAVRPSIPDSHEIPNRIFALPQQNRPAGRWISPLALPSPSAATPPAVQRFDR